MLALDNEIIIFLQSHLGSGFIKFFEIFTELGDETAIVAVIGFFYWCIDRQFGLRLFLNLSVSNIYYPMLKNTVKRLRPYMANDKIKCLQSAYSGDIADVNTEGYSFPSGHMINSTVVYGAIAGKYKNALLRASMVLILALVGCSRFILGVHYPSDVLSGLAFGLLIMKLLDLLLKHFDEKKVYIAIAVISAAGFLFCRSNDYYTGFGLFLGGLPVLLNQDKYSFERVRGIPEIIIRMAGGIIIFFGVSSLMKLPFSAEFLAGSSLGQYLFRTFRYAVTVFLALGPYTKLFKYIKIGKKA